MTFKNIEKSDASASLLHQHYIGKKEKKNFLFLHRHSIFYQFCFSCIGPFLADVIRRITAHMRGMLRDGAVLTVPSAPGPAPLKGTTPASTDATRQKLLCLTNIGGPAGLPQVGWGRLGDGGDGGNGDPMRVWGA